jgi:hypothetical protein
MSKSTRSISAAETASGNTAGKSAEMIIAAARAAVRNLFRFVFFAVFFLMPSLLRLPGRESFPYTYHFTFTFKTCKFIERFEICAIGGARPAQKNQNRPAASSHSRAGNE